MHRGVHFWRLFERDNLGVRDAVARELLECRLDHFAAAISSLRQRYAFFSLAKHDRRSELTIWELDLERGIVSRAIALSKRSAEDK